MAKLVVEKGRDKGKFLVLGEAQVFLVGRDFKTHLKLRDHQASRRHLKITTKSGEALLEDLDSSNGTFVNGERVRSHKLRTGDKVMVGETLIFYLEDESEDSVNETQTVDTLALTSVRKGELTQREVAGYRVGRLLGRGGMGTVYEAIQVSLERRVAFKVLSGELAADQQFVDRFTAEARAAGSLNHPNLVQVYDVGFANSIRFYSMEYMAKGSVEDLLRKHGKLPVAHALAVAFDAARGLEYAERKGIVHRDIKPENLMISEDDVVKIGDLGIATQRLPGQKGSGDETISGSPHYIAPEQALGKSFDHRADLYALGVSLYQILCGDTPFEGASAREVILKHLQQRPPPLGPRAPGTAPEVISLVERLMEKDPAKRPASASVLLQELVPLLRQHPVTDETAARVEGFLAKRLELNMQGIGPAPRAPSGRATPPPVSTETGLLATKSTDRSPLPPTADSGPPSPVLRRLLVGAATLVAAVGFGVGLFALASTLRARSKRIHDEHLALLAGVKSLLEKDPRACEREARNLEQRFDADGSREDFLEAHALATTAGEKWRLAEKAEHARKAETALADAHKRLESLAVDPADLEGVAKLTAAVASLEPVAKTYPGTPAGERAAADLRKATDDLALATAARAERDREEAAVSKEEARQWSAMADFCKEQRFGDAWLTYNAFQSQPHPTPTRVKATERLWAQLSLAVNKALVESLPAVRRQTNDGRYAEARETLRPLLARFEKFPDAMLKLEAERKRIEQAEHDARDPALLDETRLAKAEKDATPALKERRFDSAAAVFRAASAGADSPEGKAALEWRAARLDLSLKAIQFLFETVKAGQEGAGITFERTENGLVTRYVAYDALEATLELRFHEEQDARAGLDRKLADCTSDEIIDWSLQAARARVRHLLPCAAIALDLGRPLRAQKALDAWAQGGGGSLPESKATARKLYDDLERGK